MDAGWIPIEESWRCSQNAMGFEISKAMARNSWRSQRKREDPSQI